MNKEILESKKKIGCFKMMLIIIGSAVVIGVIGSIIFGQKSSEPSEDFSQSNTSIQEQQLEQTVVSPSELEPEQESTPTPGTKTNRDKMIEIFKENALAEWGSDYEMVNYEIENQTEAYDWVVEQTNYPTIMERAKQEWDNDYEMVKYEYENQVEAYEWIDQQTAYPDIMDRAKIEWGDDYEMVKYEYENQVEAYEAL